MHVRKNTPPASSSRGKAKPATEEWLARDPFRFPTTDSFDAFIQAIADALPCKVEAVPSAELTWKPRVPQNAKPLKVGGRVGFEGMVETFVSKKDNSGRHVLLYMPPPAKPVKELPVRYSPGLGSQLLPFIHADICAYMQFWDTGKEEDDEPMFDYTSVEYQASTSDSIASQRVSFYSFVAIPR